MRSRLLDLAAALLGAALGLILPPVLLRAAVTAVVLLTVLAVLAHLCGRSVALLVRVLARPAHRPLAGAAPPGPRALLTTPSGRRLLAWLAWRRPHLHTGSPRTGRRPLEPDVPQPLATPPP